MNEKKPLILIIEDDEELAELNARLLRRLGYETQTANSAAKARELFQAEQYDLIVLDIVLPDGDGHSLCEEFRRISDAPALFLTGRTAIEDKIKGLDKGGDYYLTKPYDREEFIAVVKSLLRRAEQAQKKVEEAYAINCGSLTLMLTERKALVESRDAGLTNKEFDILSLLVQNEDKKLSSETIYQSVWGYEMNIDTGIIRKHISMIKKKLDAENTDAFAIVTGYGGGYTFTRS